MQTARQARFQVAEAQGPRDRAGALLRPVLVIPHALLVGGPFVGFGGPLRAGALGVLAATIALLDWVSIVFTGRSIAGLQGLKRLYLRWRARVLAYACFLCDEYPPFGDREDMVYPATLELPDEPESRDHWSVGLRLLLLIPHLAVLALLLFGALAVAIVSWLMLSITGHLDGRLWRFNRDVVAYLLRVETYGLLVHDDYPPFSLAVYDRYAPVDQNASAGT
jgi:hypothetical protein